MPQNLDLPGLPDSKPCLGLADAYNIASSTDNPGLVLDPVSFNWCKFFNVIILM